MSERPHILLFVVDQLAASFLRAHGNAVTKTPAIDELAETGVVFENAYSPSPLCAPARAALMTGMPNWVSAPIRPEPARVGSPFVSHLNSG